MSSLQKKRNDPTSQRDSPCTLCVVRVCNVQKNGKGLGRRISEKLKIFLAPAAMIAESAVMLQRVPRNRVPYHQLDTHVHMKPLLNSKATIRKTSVKKP